MSDFFVTRERRATFRQVPGTAALRPGAATPLGGLVLAGAWTDTGWPDTMEGAVRSGLEAARTIAGEPGGKAMTAVIPAGVTTARDIVRPALEASLERLTPTMRQVAAYHLGLADAAGVSRQAGGGAGGHAPGRGRAGVGGGIGGGKALRPALALLSVRAAGEPAERGVPAAVAVELVHNFSLLHDDIMDGDTERRHRPTAWTVFGTPGGDPGR